MLFNMDASPVPQQHSAVSSPIRTDPYSYRTPAAYLSSPLLLFLWDLLHDSRYKSIIDWTSIPGEFEIKTPYIVASLWGKKKKVPRMDYDKMTRGIRFCYPKGLISKPKGKRFTFKFEKMGNMLEFASRSPSTEEETPRKSQEATIAPWLMSEPLTNDGPSACSSHQNTTDLEPQFPIRPTPMRPSVIDYLK